jgi:hypothetical protein
MIDADSARVRLSAVAGIRYYDHGNIRRACLCAWGEIDGGRESPMADAASFDQAVVALYETCIGFVALVTNSGRRYVFDKLAEKWKRG